MEITLGFRGVCDKAEIEIIIERTVVTLVASHTNISCNGEADGTLTIDSSTEQNTDFYLKKN
jgi:hypothetical protein